MEHYRVMNRHGRLLFDWIPACAGMTVSGAGMTVSGIGMAVSGIGMTVRYFVLKRFVMLVKTSIQWLIIRCRRLLFDWIPACAGMTVSGAGMTVSGAGMAVSGAGMMVSGAGMAVGGTGMTARYFVLKRFVMLVKTSIQWLIIRCRRLLFDWIPACAGMTVSGAGMTVSGAGMTVSGIGMTVSGAGMTVRGAGMTVSGTGMTLSDTGMMVSDLGALNSLFPHAFRVAI